MNPLVRATYSAWPGRSAVGASSRRLPLPPVRVRVAAPVGEEHRAARVLAVAAVVTAGAPAPARASRPGRLP